MGSGTYGGGGGGGVGRGSSGRRFGSIKDVYKFVKGKVSLIAKSDKKAEKEINNLFTSGHLRDYLYKVFTSPLIDQIYQELFDIYIHLVVNKSWNGIKTYYQIDDGNGCLLKLINKVLQSAEQSETNENIQAIASVCFNDFFVMALSGKDDVYFYGNSKQIISELNKEFFYHTSNNFLALLIWHIIESQSQKLPPTTNSQMQRLSTEKANKIVDSFKNRYKIPQNITWNQLFRTIQTNFDWFLKELRK